MTESSGPIRLGVYEKSLPTAMDWNDTFSLARTLGFDFYELAIDPSPERLARLSWTDHRRAAVRQAGSAAGIEILVVTLSAHREIPLGSASAETRRRAGEILDDAIELAVDLGARLVQVPGYFVFTEPHHPDARRWFLDGLAAGCERAAELGITLGLENMDGEDVVGIGDAVAVIEDLDHHPAIGLHVDVGNLAANDLHVIDELERATPHLVAVDLKDTLPGRYRRVPFGDGIVPFDDVFAALSEEGFTGPYAIEMWNDAGDAEMAARARRWILERART